MTTKIENLMQIDLQAFAKKTKFKIESYDECISCLRSMLQSAINTGAYPNNLVLMPRNMSCLFGRGNNPLVSLHDIINWTGRNTPEALVFKYRLSKMYPSYLTFIPEKDELRDMLCEKYMPSTNKSMSVVTTRGELCKKANEYNIKHIKFMCKCAGIDVTTTEIRRKLTTGFTLVGEAGSGNVTKKNTQKIITLLINTLKKMPNWTCYNGFAGTGKSYNAVKSVGKNEQVLCMSLSWTIPLNLKQRLIKNGIDAKNITCIPYAAMHKVDFSKFDRIIVDEISQCGVKEYKKFYEMISAAPNAQYIFMGDVHQIKSFLSGGSLLNTLIEEFKGDKRVINLTKVMRSKNADLNKAVIDFAETGKLSHIFNCPKNYRLTDYNVIVSGANINIARLNNEYVSQKFNLKPGMISNVNTSDYDVQDYNMDTNTMLVQAMRKGHEVHVLGRRSKSRDKVKIETNEKWTASYSKPNHSVFLRSEIDPSKTLYMPVDDFISGQFFVPGYAINVNKAQGLEWDRVLVIANTQKKNGTLDKNLYENREAMYVALSRGKEDTNLDCNGPLDKICTPYIRANNYAEVQPVIKK